MDMDGRDGSSGGANGSDRDLVAARTRIVLRPIGSPLPLGLLALAPAGLLLSCYQIGAFTQAEARTVALLVLGFAVPLELISAVLCFLARDSLAGTALGVFAGAWLASGLVLRSTAPGATSPAFGVFLLSIAGALAILVAGAAGGKAGPALVMLAGIARFVLAGLFELTGSVGVEHASAIFGFVLVGAAIYTSLATEIEDLQGESRLPIGRRKRAAMAMQGGFEDQLEGLEREAGVRQQL
jgi:succinate-acetate transporter protein